MIEIVSDNTEPNQPNQNRRKFIKSAAVVAGVATVATVGFTGLLKPGGTSDTSSSTSSSRSTSTSTESTTSTASSTPSPKVISADALVAYAYLGPEGNVSTERDANGNVSKITYGPLAVQITRNSDGTVASIQTSIENESIKEVDTILRNQDGSISGVSKTWPS